MSSFIAAGTAYAHARHQHDSVLHLLLDVRLPADRRPDLGRLRLAGQGLHDRRHRRPHHAGRRRAAASGRPQPAQRHGLSHRARLRPGVRLRDDDDHSRRHAADVRRAAKTRSTTSRSTTKTTAMPRCPRASKKASSAASTSSRPRTPARSRPHVQLFGSGAILREALRAQEILAEKFEVSSNVWSVTSYNELAATRRSVERWNMLHPDRDAARSYLEEVLAGEQGPFVAASRLRAGAWPSRSALGAGRAVRPGHRRFRPQRDSRRTCGGISRSTPKRSPWRRCTSLPSAARWKPSAWPRPSRTWASIPKRSIPIQHERRRAAMMSQCQTCETRLRTRKLDTRSRGHRRQGVEIHGD